MNKQGSSRAGWVETGVLLVLLWGATVDWTRDRVSFLVAVGLLFGLALLWILGRARGREVNQFIGLLIIMAGAWAFGVLVANAAGYGEGAAGYFEAAVVERFLPAFGLALIYYGFRGRRKRASSLRGLGTPATVLDVDVAAAGPLQPMSPDEAAALGGRFRDEQLFYGPDVEWLGYTWELRLASVSGRTYKVALEVAVPDRDEASSLAKAVFKRLSDVLGRPTKKRKPLWLWDAEDGNAVLQLNHLAGDERITLFLTSRAVRGFAPA